MDDKLQTTLKHCRIAPASCCGCYDIFFNPDYNVNSWEGSFLTAICNECGFELRVWDITALLREFN